MTSKPILLISGPSGGGKSTFIRQLADRSLPREILDRIPDAASWPIIEANDFLKGALSTDSLPAGDGWLVHYDIVFIHRYGIGRYEKDPSLGLLNLAAPLHVVFVRPDFETVQSQFLDRQARHQRKRSTFSLLWSRYFRLPLRRAMAPLTGKPTRSTEDLYRENKWLAGCYRQWETYLHQLAEEHPGTRISVVEPSCDTLPLETFRLVAPATRSHQS